MKAKKTEKVIENRKLLREEMLSEFHHLADVEAQRHACRMSVEGFGWLETSMAEINGSGSLFFSSDFVSHLCLHLFINFKSV